jgi:two-component system, OmpR family, sensor kinase
MSRERLAVVAHELRSPVAALAALAERAGAARSSSDTFARMIVLALEAGRDIERLLLDPELLSLRPVPVDLAEVALASAAPNVAVGVQRVTVDGDPTRLRQALANLVANGLRHGTEVTIAGGPLDDRAVLWVRDDGPGIDPGIDPFARGVSGAGSTGYGLWLARAIVEAHGGNLEVEQSGGPGALFRLSLPRASGEPG